jgi:hypothetical protein
MKRQIPAAVVFSLVLILLLSIKAPAQALSIEDLAGKLSPSKKAVEKYSSNFGDFYSLNFGSKFASFIKVSFQGEKRNPGGIEIFGCNGKLASIEKGDPLNVSFIEGADRYIRYIRSSSGETSDIYDIDGGLVASLPISLAEASPVGTFFFPGRTRYEGVPLVIYDSRGSEIFSIAASTPYSAEAVSESEVLLLNSDSLALWDVFKKERKWAADIGHSNFNPEIPYTLLFSRKADIIVYMNIDNLMAFDFSGNRLWGYSSAFIGDLNMVGLQDEDGLVAISKVLPGNQTIEVDFYSRLGESIANALLEIDPQYQFWGNWELKIHFYPQGVILRFDTRKRTGGPENEHFTGFLTGSLENPSVSVVPGFWSVLSGCDSGKNLIGIDPASGKIKAFSLGGK